MTDALANDGEDRADGASTILAVDDEPYALAILTKILEPTYAVRTATCGEEALERLGSDVAVVLLDRRMPDMDGDEVLARMRSRGDETPVVMVTGVEPDLDIVEMAFDAYLVKPVRAAEVLEVIEAVLTRDAYDATLRELYSISARVSALEGALGPEELAGRAEYEALCRRREELSAAARGRLADLMDQRDPAVVYRDVLQEFKS